MTTAGQYVLFWSIIWFLITSIQYMIDLAPNQRTAYALFRPVGHPTEEQTPLALAHLAYAFILSIPYAVLHVPILIAHQQNSGCSNAQYGLIFYRVWPCIVLVAACTVWFFPKR